MSRFITCTNEDGIMIRFGREFSPWLLKDVSGLYEAENNVYRSNNTMTDGSTYQGTTVKERNIVLTMMDNGNHQHARKVLYDVFKSKTPGTLVYEEGEDRKSIDYYVESKEITTMGNNRLATVSLICPDPYFMADQDATEEISGWNPLFEFEHEFQFGGEPLGEKSNAKLTTITNESAADNIGITFTLTMDGDVVNPSITKVETNQTIKVGTSDRPLNLVYGDILIITTGNNDKHVYLIHEGVQTEINMYLAEESEFIQLMRGDNSFGCDADVGSENVTVNIAYRYMYEAV